ncbi:MAG: hypothetical protein R3E79_28920 [Caldilineaceae bacterium]
MYERLLTRFCHDEAKARCGYEEVTIQHSRALLKFYQDLMGLDEATPKAAKQVAGWLRNLGQLSFHPIRVFSPYQLLKAGYSLKGYETLLVDYTDALFIFDDSRLRRQRLALIISMIDWLAPLLSCLLSVMTATSTPTAAEEVNGCAGIGAGQLDQGDARRVSPVTTPYGASVAGTTGRGDCPSGAGRLAGAGGPLICLNWWPDAQRLYRQLKSTLRIGTETDIVLLHGRFNGEDRSRKERILLERAGVGRRQPGARPFITVATQVVEVSLDVDFDTFTLIHVVFRSALATPLSVNWAE